VGGAARFYRSITETSKVAFTRIYWVLKTFYGGLIGFDFTVSISLTKTINMKA
jgi:hypothetical protein